MKKKLPPCVWPALAVLCIGAVLLGACQSADSGGWDIRDSGTYYLVNGQPATGWLELDGTQYYLGSDGRLATGWQTIDGETYYFREDGSMYTGWLELDGARYYLRQGGSMVTGWLSQDGQRYYLTSDGSAAVGIAEVDGEAYVFGTDGHLATGLVDLGNTKAYAGSGGHPVTGWVETDRARYYFDASGRMHTGWLELDGFTYYLLPDGSAARGKRTIDGSDHYFASNGQEIILVNPWNTVPEGYTVELESIGGEHQAAKILCDDFREMMDDCRAAGLHPVVCSSYRTQEYQEALFSRKVEFYKKKGYSEQEAAVQAGHSVAIPGTSEHQLGLALDIIDNSNWNLDESQAKTPTQQWLMSNSWRYGFILRYPDGTSDLTGIIYEPWHYRYVGREVAADIYELGVCLEEYLESLTESVG